MRISCGERGYIWNKLKFQKNLLKISFQQNFEFSKSVEWFKSYNFFPSMYKKNFRNDQDVCWLEHDYMVMKIWLSETSPIIISTWPLKLAHCAPPPPPTPCTEFSKKNNKKIPQFFYRPPPPTVSPPTLHIVFFFFLVAIFDFTDVKNVTQGRNGTEGTRLGFLCG